MPEMTEVQKKAAEEKVDSNTDSDSDSDDVPELEETGAQGTNPMAAAAGLNEDLVSKVTELFASVAICVATSFFIE